MEKLSFVQKNSEVIYSQSVKIYDRLKSWYKITPIRKPARIVKFSASHQSDLETIGKNIDIYPIAKNYEHYLVLRQAAVDGTLKNYVAWLHPTHNSIFINNRFWQNDLEFNEMLIEEVTHSIVIPRDSRVGISRSDLKKIKRPYRTFGHDFYTATIRYSNMPLAVDSAEFHDLLSVNYLLGQHSSDYLPKPAVNISGIKKRISKKDDDGAVILAKHTAQYLPKYAAAELLNYFHGNAAQLLECLPLLPKYSGNQLWFSLCYPILQGGNIETIIEMNLPQSAHLHPLLRSLYR